MKMTDLKSKILAVLATLAFLSIYVPSIANDFFPLDVWEEMDAWEQTNAAAPEPNILAYQETMPMGVDDAEMVDVSFPFDVWKELNDLGGIDGITLKNWKTFNLNYGTLKEDTTNPYWMPEEYRTP